MVSLLSINPFLFPGGRGLERAKNLIKTVSVTKFLSSFLPSMQIEEQLAPALSIFSSNKKTNNFLMFGAESF